MKRGRADDRDARRHQPFFARRYTLPRGILIVFEDAPVAASIRALAALAAGAATGPLLVLATERFIATAGRTAIIVTHRLASARIADRILVLDGGRIVEDGTHDELLALRGLYHRMFTAQAAWYRRS